MTASRTTAGAPSNQPPPDNTLAVAHAPRIGWWLCHDRVLLVAVAVGALLFSYQLAVTLLHPAWYGPVTYWLRATLAWLVLLIVVAVSRWLRRARRPEAAAWWMLSAALLSYAIANTLWSVGYQFLFLHAVPFPGLPDLFFLLQYPCFLPAVLLIPQTGFWGPRLIMLLDGLLVMGAATALSWHFLLAPLFLESGLSPLAKAVGLAYPLGDLVVLFGLTVLLLRPLHFAIDRPVVGILVVAFVCLIVGDSWAIGLLLQPGHVYRTGGVPLLFRLACYLLLLLAALAQFRLAQHAALWEGDAAARGRERPGYPRPDLLASLRLFLPIIAGLLASALIAIHATLMEESDDWHHLIAPLAVGFFLLLLVILRQGVAFLEFARQRHELEVARAQELAQRELIRRKDEFLSVVSHELKTPLTSLQGNQELLMRRLTLARRQDAADHDRVGLLNMALAVLERGDQSLRRIARLVNDILDDSRVQQGRLAVHLERGDLATVVEAAVDEQRLLASERRIDLELPIAGPVEVLFDPDRIAQVVANYLTNALKYSNADRPVRVWLQVKEGQACVSVWDEGVGVPSAAQAHLWDRFSRVEEVRVQSGSGIGLGIGLHVSKAIIEAHQGQVGVYSEVGHGSIFWFTLPLAPTPT